MNEWVIESKLHPPPTSANFLRRERLLARLNNCIRPGVCVVHAAAGCGKTAALAQWHETLISQQMPVAWISLDERDQTLSGFLRYFVAACRFAGVPEFSAPQAPDYAAMSSEESGLAILTTLSRLKNPLVLILDDFHRAAGPETRHFVERAIHAGRDQLSLVISTREMPEDISFADLRLRGDLEEIFQSDLSFELDETETLFNRAQEEVDRDWLIELQQRTEGWAVALNSVRRWLAEGMSTSAVLERLSGRDSDLSDYFLEQAFLDLPSTTQNFLLATSILERVNGDVGAALCPEVDAWQLLRDLEKQDAFVQRADKEGSWYRYHRLYAEFLAERLRRSKTLSIDTLHQRATEWFTGSNLQTEAIHHAIAADNLAACASLLESLGGWQFALRGDIALVQSVLKRLSAEDLLDYPRLWLARIYLSVRVGHHRAGEEDLKHFRSKMDVRWPGDESIQAEYALIHTLVERYSDRPVTNEAIERIERLDGVLDLHNDVLQAVRANFLCAMYREVAQYDKGEEHASRAISFYRASGAPYAEAFIHFHLGILRMRQARYKSAEVCYDTGLEIATRLFGQDCDLAAIGKVFLAECYLETGRLAQASAILDRALAHVEQADAWLEVYAAGYLTQLRIAAMTADAATMERVLTRAQNVAKRRRLPRLVWLVQLQAAELGSRDGLEAFSPTQFDHGAEVWDPVSRNLQLSVEVRGLLSERLSVAAEDCLEAPRRAAKAEGSLRVFTQLSLLLAAARWLSGRTEAALEAFESAVSVALVDEGRQLFVEDAELLLPLIDHILDGDSPTASARISFLRKLRAEMREQRSGEAETQALLSPREVEVLRCLMMGESNREIAASKSLSINTVKFHLKNIFGKLGASSRDEAVALAIRDRLI